MRKLYTLLTAAMLLFFIVGCTGNNSVNTPESDSGEIKEDLKDTGEDLKEDMKDTGEDIKDTADDMISDGKVN